MLRQQQHRNGAGHEFQRCGAYFDHIMASENIRYNAYSGIRSAGVIQVLEVVRASKLSQAGLVLDTASARWLAYRLCRGGPPDETMPVQVREKFGRFRAAKVLAWLDSSGHPDSLPALSLVPAGSARLVFGAGGAHDLAGLAPGASVAASVLTPEPVLIATRRCRTGPGEEIPIHRLVHV